MIDMAVGLFSCQSLHTELALNILCYVTCHTFEAEKHGIISCLWKVIPSGSFDISFIRT